MLTKKLLILLFAFAIYSCTIPDRTTVESIIRDFETTHITDKREMVFDIIASRKNGKLVVSGEIDSKSLKNKLLAQLAHFEFDEQIQILPDSTVGEKRFGLINLSVANLRSNPKHSAELATQALLGTPVKILKKTGAWYLIQTPDKYISWVDASGIEPISENMLNTWRAASRAVLISDNDFVYETEELKNPISDVCMGNILLEKERRSGIIRLEFPDGRTGYSSIKNWIDLDLLKESTIDTTNLISMAKQFTGRPYLWGGTSSRGMDCSGYVKMLYFMNGIVLARDASLQTKHGQLIQPDPNFENLLAGDLLFFGTKAGDTEKERVTHVALSLGKTEFIHASGRIQQNSLNPKSPGFSEYRLNSFIRVRRITENEKFDGIRYLKDHPWY